MDKIKAYIAGPWFTPKQDQVQTKLENWARFREDLQPFLPRHDGIELDADQYHDTGLRRKVFQDNIDHILGSDIVIANLDGSDGYQDTGTLYEIGYAQAYGIPIIGYQDGFLGKMRKHLDFLRGNILMVDGFPGLEDVYRYAHEISGYTKREPVRSEGDKVLLGTPGNNTQNLRTGEYLKETLEEYFSPVVELERDGCWANQQATDNIFSDTKMLFANIDDREPVVSWAIGQAYARGVPVISYSDHDYGVNLMLILSIKQHIKGREDLIKILDQIKEQGIENLPEIDISEYKVH